MKIRYKTLLILGLITVFLMSALYVVTQKLIFDGISASEKEESISNAQRVVKNLSIDLDNMNKMVNDWAGWDDTYRFVQDNNTNYVESNLVGGTFVNLHLNLMLFFDTDQQLTFGAMYDISSESFLTLQEQDIAQVLSYGPLFMNDIEETDGGLILLNHTPMLVVSHPILTSLDEGPVRGTLIMGRYFDESELSTISDGVGLPLSMVAIDQPFLPPDFRLAKNSLSIENQVFTQTLNENSMAAYVLFQDVSGNPVVITKAEDTRTAYAQGKESMKYTAISFVAIGIITFIVFTILLEKQIISRLGRLNDTVVRIWKTSDNSKRVAVKGNDELSSLGQSINSMLDVIEHHTLTLEETVKERTTNLRESQEKLKSVLNTCPDAIINTDFEGNIIDFNPKMTEICGSNRNDLLGKSVFSFMNEKDRQKLFDKVAEMSVNSGNVINIECNIMKMNGAEYPAELSISVLNDPQGVPVGFVSVVRDLTERRLLEERLFKSERLAAIGELAGMIGHDLRNPLTAIKNAYYLLEKRCAACEKSNGVDMLDIIDHSIDHANKVINDLLDYSREIHLELAECTPKSLLTDALSMVKNPDNVKIVEKVSSNIKLEADKSRIVRVFVNLSKNAFDAMPNGGTLEIRSHSDNDSVIIAFADNGIGISEDTLGKIFTPLFTTKAQGMGFGLAICKRIVEAHGGRISVESVVNKGTTFTVTLPIKPNAKGLKLND